MLQPIAPSPADRGPGLPENATLILCTLLHAFTHALGTLLVPLYLMMVADLHLHGVRQASLIVTVYGFVYCLASYGGGMLADRFDRKWLLAIGLAGNSLAILAMGLTRQYEWLIVCGVVAGLFGTLFHPCANALVPALFPKSPGMAIGILGMGSGLGFFAGPQFAGWRAQGGAWTSVGPVGPIWDWQRPCIEMGLIGLACSILFLLVAREVRGRRRHVVVPDPEEQDAMLPQRVAVEAIVTEFRGRPETQARPLEASLRRRVLAIAITLGCRDFAGVASLTAASLYLQKAHGFDARRTGFMVGGMMLFSILVNPIAVWMSPGRRRLPMFVITLVAGGIAFALTPHVPVLWAMIVLCTFQAFQLGSYAVGDAAMLERVDPAVRGRVVGLFLTLAGTFASLSPFAIGLWVDVLGERARSAKGFVPIFGTLGAMMLIATASVPIIARLGKVEPRAAGAREHAPGEPLPAAA